MLRLACVLFLVGVVTLHVEGSSTRRMKRSVENPIFTDCGRAGKYMEFRELHFSPNPIVVPGTLTLTFHAINNRTLPNMDITVEMSRKAKLGNWEWDIPVPCVQKVGSCTYEDICELMKEGSTKDLPILRKLRTALEASGAPSECPIRPSHLNIRDLDLELPELPAGPLSSLADGTYEVTYRILRHNTQQEIGCLSVQASVTTVRDDCWYCG